jgi:hypothetical protein
MKVRKKKRLRTECFGESHSYLPPKHLDTEITGLFLSFEIRRCLLIVIFGVI